MIRYLVGDVFDRLREIADGSVSLVASSPPFIALRAYLPDDHPDKAKEIGSEPDPATFIDTLLALTAEWGRVLAPWGSIAIELGDTYSGSGSPGGDYAEGGMRAGQPITSYSGARSRIKQQPGTGRAVPVPTSSPSGQGWPIPKCLTLVPQAYALSLAYGINVLTGEPSPAGQWLVRNMVVWHRPNPAVGALADKYRPSTSYITIATRARDRWFDLTAVRGEPSPNTHARTAKGVDARATTGKTAAKDGNFDTLDTMHRTGGAPPLDCWFDEHDTWTITTQPSSLAHYAMWPPRLAERLVLSMCPRDVCSVCGTPRRRIERTTNAVGTAVGRAAWTNHQATTDRMHSGVITAKASDAGVPDMSARETLGWSDCGCDYMDALRQGITPTGPQKWIPGTVLDPFAGTGTTLCVADLHGRDTIGIDIDARNELLMDQRYAECRRALFGVRPELPGQEQLDMFAAVS